MSHKETLITLSPYQEKWIADKSLLKIWEKSRRIGATESEAYNSVMEISEKKSTAYMSYDEESIKHFLNKCKEWSIRLNMPCSEIQEESFKSGYVLSLYFENGHKIVSIDPSVGYNAYNCKRVVIDELAYVKDLENYPAYKFVDYLVEEKRQLSIISSHNGESNYFNELIKEDGWSKHKTTVDDAIKEGSMSPEIVEQIKDQLSTEAFDEEYNCIPRKEG